MPCILLNPKFITAFRRTRQFPCPEPRPPKRFFKMHHNFIFPTTSKPSKCPLSFRCNHQTVYAYPFFPICANCPTCNILLSLIALTIFGEVHKSWSCSKCSCIVVNRATLSKTLHETYVHYCAHLEPNSLNMYWGKLFEPDIVGNNENIWLLKFFSQALWLSR